MPFHNPPFAALRALESAARHLNFTRAAEENNVTQSAVSPPRRAPPGHARQVRKHRPQHKRRVRIQGRSDHGMAEEVHAGLVPHASWPPQAVHPQC